MFQTKVVDKIKIHIVSSLTFSAHCAVKGDNVKNYSSTKTGNKCQYGFCAVHAG